MEHTSVGDRDRSTWVAIAAASEPTTRQAQMGKIFGYLKGIHAANLIDLGVRLGLFAHLASASVGVSPKNLAEHAGLHEPYVQRWCETACALELLDFDPATGYVFAPFMQELLGQPESAFYLGGFPRAHLILAEDYQRYPESFRTGGTHPYQEHDETFLRAVAEATQSLPRMFMDAVLPDLPELHTQLAEGATVLDVGCGAGHALVAFAERFPAVRCVGIDVEDVSVGMARKLIAERGLTHRVEARTVSGASWPAELTGAFDLVTMFLVLHEVRPELKSRVLARCRQALRPGGTLLLFDERYPNDARESRDPNQIFAVMAQWYELIWGNVVNTGQEIRGLLEANGFVPVREAELSRFYILLARREETSDAAHTET